MENRDQMKENPDNQSSQKISSSKFVIECPQCKKILKSDMPINFCHNCGFRFIQSPESVTPKTSSPQQMVSTYPFPKKKHKWNIWAGLLMPLIVYLIILIKSFICLSSQFTGSYHFL